MMRISNGVIKKLYFIIATWNGEKFVADCLHSVFNQENGNFGVIVVDNGSTDKTKEIIKTNFKEVILIEIKKNIGFAKANNLGIKKAFAQGAEEVILLNQDTEIVPNFSKEGLKYLEENSGVGLASPIIFYPEKNRIWFAGSKIYHDQEILFHPTTKIGDHLHKKMILTADDKNNPIDWLPACALLIKKEVFEKIGYFDETFFMYGEDVDFSLRAKKAGFKLGFLVDTSVIHKENISARLKLNGYLFKKIVLKLKARLLIVWRYYSFKEKCYYFIKLIYTPLFQLFYVFKKIFS